MWIEVKSADNIEDARKWREVFENDNVPARVLPRSVVTRGQDPGYSVLVPTDKEHLAREALRKL